ncbi:MAG: hypothetical protein UE295_03315 [Acutalibacteraceae bacterium]|nr:hypothetical protein [Acutalibacteraceae bacterium]
MGNIVSKIGIVFGIILILFSAIPILTNIVTLFFEGIQSNYFAGLMVKLLFEVLILASIISMCYYLYKRRVRKKKICTQKVDAKVIEIKTSIGSKGQRMYSPVFEYIVNGITYRKESSIGASWCNMKVGSTYKTLYVNPHNPVEIYEVAGINGITIFCVLVVSIIILALSGVIFNDFTLLIEELNFI